MPTNRTPTTPPKAGAALPQGPRKGRLSPALRKAIKLRVEDGRTIASACAEAGISEAGFYKAMKRDTVLAHIAAVQQAFVAEVERRRAGYKARALEVAAEIMERGKSEAARMRAVELLAGERSAPTVAVQVNNHLGDARGYAYPEPGARIVEISQPAQGLDDDERPTDDDEA